MDAQEIVTSIGDGIAEALKTNELFLGIDLGTFHNADIRPEYVTTVEVGKKLVAPDRQVTLEAAMRDLRKQAANLAWMHQGRSNTVRQSLDAALATFIFGKKDGKRLDVLVRSSDQTQPPLLMVEAKLGVRNLNGVIKDIDRLVRLFDMYEAVGLLTRHTIYGAVVFHSMDEGNGTGHAGALAKVMVRDVSSYLATVTSTRPWLYVNAGLPRQGTVIQPITGYVEHYEDGKSETVFARECFHFAPGLVLLGNASDVANVQF